jgi:asparagine synthase (glutamine-hydrolysing)
VTNRKAYDRHSDVLELLTDDAASEVHESHSARHEEYYEAVAHLDSVSQALYLDAKLFLPELNLAYCDKMSMAASMEVRVPYLDGEVVAAATRMPPEMKIRGFTGKYALREALRPDLPDWVLRRRKAGFGAPIRRWLQTDLAEMVDDLLGPDSIRRRGLLRPDAVERIIRQHRSGEADHTYRIWALLTLEVWQRSVLENSQGF